MSEGVVLTLAPRLHVSVDFWRRARPPLAAHFLTHMHADHTEGLTDDWRAPQGGPIYCSPATLQLLQDKWPALSARATALPVGETTVLRLAPPCSSGGGAVSVSVTPLDACHCLGAVMFLLEGPCGRILHTGDCRWELAAQGAQPWHPALTYAPVDLLLLDNTYCHPRFEAPTRAAAAAAVLRLVRTHPDHDIVIGVDSLGKEELLAEVATALAPGEQLGVPPARAQALWIAGHDPSLFTPHVADARVRVVPRWQLTLERLAKLNRTAPTLGIVASGFGAADTSRPPAAAAAGACPSRSAAEVQAALTVLRRSSGGGDVCNDSGSSAVCNNGGGSTLSDTKLADGNGGGDCSLSSSAASGDGSRRLNLSAYAALLAAFRVPDPSDAAPPTPEGAHHFWTLSSAPPDPVGRLFDYRIAQAVN